MKLKETLKQYKTVIVTVVVGLIVFTIFHSMTTQPQTDPENIIIMGTFDKNVSIGDRIYIQGTVINFPTDEKYNFELIKPSGDVLYWGYKSTTTNPTGVVPFNFYVTEFGEHTFTMVKTGDGSFVASEKFILVDKQTI